RCCGGSGRERRRRCRGSVPRWKRHRPSRSAGAGLRRRRRRRRKTRAGRRPPGPRPPPATGPAPKQATEPGTAPAALPPLSRRLPARQARSFLASLVLIRPAAGRAALLVLRQLRPAGQAAPLVRLGVLLLVGRL